MSSAESEKAQQYIINILSRTATKPFNGNYKHKFQYQGFMSEKVGHNLIGLIKGTQHPNKYIVLSAHFDHIGKQGRKIFNGADDNASGTAALLEYAAKFSKHPPKHSILLLFTDGEENNLSGAKAFIRDFASLKGNIIVNVNLDMIAGSKTTKTLRYIERGLPKILNDTALKKWKISDQEAAIKVKKGFKRRASFSPAVHRIKWEVASDHGVFYKEKIPFVYFGVGPHKNYHTENDNFININHNFYLAAVEEIFRRILFIDQHI